MLLHLIFFSSNSLKFKLQIKPPAPAERFTQILSVGIGGSALGPQFVAEALAPDNPPLKVFDKMCFKHLRVIPPGPSLLGVFFCCLCV